MTLLGTIGISELTHWTKQLAYTITPKSGPMRRMEPLLDANRALSNDLPRGLLKRDHWLAAGKLLMHASETGAAADVQMATDELVKAIEHEGWMSRAHLPPCATLVIRQR